MGNSADVPANSLKNISLSDPRSTPNVTEPSKPTVPSGNVSDAHVVVCLRWATSPRMGGIQHLFQTDADKLEYKVQEKIQETRSFLEYDQIGSKVSILVCTDSERPETHRPRTANSIGWK